MLGQVIQLLGEPASRGRYPFPGFAEAMVHQDQSLAPACQTEGREQARAVHHTHHSLLYPDLVLVHTQCSGFGNFFPASLFPASINDGAQYVVLRERGYCSGQVCGAGVT